MRQAIVAENGPSETVWTFWISGGGPDGAVGAGGAPGSVGVVVDGNCLIERLGVALRRADLAAYLLETRERLELVRDRAEAEQTHRELSRRVGLELKKEA